MGRAGRTRGWKWGWKPARDEEVSVNKTRVAIAEAAMRVTLREVLRQCRTALRKTLAKRDRWVKEWPGQPGITSTQIQWTSDCTRVLLHCKWVLRVSAYEKFSYVSYETWGKRGWGRGMERKMEKRGKREASSDEHQETVRENEDGDVRATRKDLFTHTHARTLKYIHTYRRT